MRFHCDNMIKASRQREGEETYSRIKIQRSLTAALAHCGIDHLTEQMTIGLEE